MANPRRIFHGQIAHIAHAEASRARRQRDRIRRGGRRLRTDHDHEHHRTDRGLGGPGAPPPTASPKAPATATTIPHASVIGQFGHAAAVSANSSGTASSSCPNGWPMVAGGFIVRLDTSNGLVTLAPDESYPSSSTTWTVHVSTLADSAYVTAIAVCLQANFPVMMQTVQNSNGGPTTTVSCPTGSTLTGGRFRSGGGTTVASQPSGTGWQISTGAPFGGSATPVAFALCATQGLHVGSVQSMTKTVANGSVTVSGASCPSGQYPVGGGYNGYLPSGDSFWRVDLNGPDTGRGSSPPDGRWRSTAGNQPVPHLPSTKSA